MANKIKFILNGCDISFYAEAPKDITLQQLLEQTDKIVPDYCACGIWSAERYLQEYKGMTEADIKPDLVIDYDSVCIASENPSCRIVENWRRKDGPAQAQPDGD